jgi:hypothetical protein
MGFVAGLIRCGTKGMAALVPAIHVLLAGHEEDVDARDKRGHDVLKRRG